VQSVAGKDQERVAAHVAPTATLRGGDRMSKKKKKKKVRRSAKSGKFVSKDFAEKHPATTETETRA